MVVEIERSEFFPLYVYHLVGQYFPDSTEEHRIETASLALKEKDPVGSLKKAWILEWITLYEG